MKIYPGGWWWMFGLIGIALVGPVPGQPPGAAPPPAAPPPAPANNSACLVCHVNFEEEALAKAHARAKVGCTRCHGKSSAHTDDESNRVPPEIMFAKAKINPACLQCHAPSRLSALHAAVLAGTETKTPFCTDCHGEHRMSHRTRQWDKTTGKLLPRKK